MRTLVDLILGSGRLNTQRPCLRDGDTSLTYDEYSQRAARFGSALSDAGIGPGDRVLIAMPTGWRGLIAIGGALLAGAIVAPTNNAAKGRELSHVMQLVNPKAIVASEGPLRELKSGDGLAKSNALRIVIDGSNGATGDIDIDMLLETGGSSAQRRPNAADPAFIMFTSGTTGAPKGVVHSHQDYVRFIKTYGRLYSRPRETVLNFLPLNHQSSTLLSFLTPMFMGSEIVTLPRFDPQSFWRAACDYKVNWTVTMPPVPAMLVEAVAARPKRHFLRETLGSGTPKDWNTFERVHGVDMSSGYGSTESTLVTISPSARVAGARLESPLSGSYCGSAIPGWSDVRITAEDTSPMAPDEPGDIQLRGGALFSRYWDNDAATRTAFTEDGWFRTGDIGYLNIAGDLYLMRRGDDRIRRNGENIDPAEIEAVIKEHPAVADVGVAGIPDARRGEEILACIVVVPGMAISQTEILTHCEKVLAKFKVPRYIEFRSHIPRTSATLRVQRTVLRQEANKQTWHDRFS